MLPAGNEYMRRLATLMIAIFFTTTCNRPMVASNTATLRPEVVRYHEEPPIINAHMFIEGRKKIEPTDSLQIIHSGDKLKSGDQLAVQAVIDSDAYVYLFLISADQQISLQYPNLQGYSPRHSPNVWFRLPAYPQWIQLDGSHGNEDLILVAQWAEVSDRRSLQDRLINRLRVINKEQLANNSFGHTARTYTKPARPSRKKAGEDATEASRSGGGVPDVKTLPRLIFVPRQDSVAPNSEKPTYDQTIVPKQDRGKIDMGGKVISDTDIILMEPGITAIRFHFRHE